MKLKWCKTVKISLLFYFLFFLTSLYAQEQEITLTEKVRSVQFYLANNSTNESETTDVLAAPVAQLNTKERLIIEFDWVSDESLLAFQYKIFHCTKDWKKSPLLGQDYLDEYNEFISYQIVPSSTRALQYYHCKGELPRVLIAGNYLLYVYDANNGGAPILSRKFMVTENKARITFEQNASTIYTDKQALQFKIVFPSSSPFDFKDFSSVFIRKNERWDTMKEIKKVAFFNPNEKSISYTPLFSNTIYEAGNEFHVFDGRNERGIGVETREVRRNGDTTQYLLFPDKTLLNTYYTRKDINGKFIIDNYIDGEGNTNSEYINILFTLDYSLPIDGTIYLIGAFNNWQPTHPFNLTFNPEIRKYQLSTNQLKQGYYNYKYVVVDKLGNIKESFFSGNFAQTENKYEVIVYYFDQQLQTDKIIAYQTFSFPVVR